MSCTGSKKCSCGCDKPYGGYERVPLTFGDGGYISKRITEDLDRLVAEQYGGNLDLKKEALAMMNTMAYGGLTDKGSGSVDATVDPNAGLSTSAYDAGKTKDGIAFYGKKEGTFVEEVKDAGRFGLKAVAGLTTGIVDTAANMLGADINTSDAVRGWKLGERDKNEIERREKAAGIASTVGAAGATIAVGALTGNPQLIAKGAEQTFTELGEIDPESKGLQTVSNLGKTASNVYGAVAGGGPSAEAVGGGAPIGTTSGVDEVGNAVSYAPGANPDGAGNKYGDIINQFAGGIPGMAYGGPVSYKSMHVGGYATGTGPGPIPPHVNPHPDRPKYPSIGTTDVSKIEAYTDSLEATAGYRREFDNYQAALNNIENWGALEDIGNSINMSGHSADTYANMARGAVGLPAQGNVVSVDESKQLVRREYEEQRDYMEALLRLQQDYPSIAGNTSGPGRSGTSYTDHTFTGASGDTYAGHLITEAGEQFVPSPVQPYHLIEDPAAAPPPPPANISYETAYKGVDKGEYPTLESFIEAAENYKKYGSNTKPIKEESNIPKKSSSFSDTDPRLITNSRIATPKRAPVNSGLTDAQGAPLPGYKYDGKGHIVKMPHGGLMQHFDYTTDPPETDTDPPKAYLGDLFVSGVDLEKLNARPSKTFEDGRIEIWEDLTNEEQEEMNPYYCNRKDGCLGSSYNSYDMLIGQRYPADDFLSEAKLKKSLGMQSADKKKLGKPYYEDGNPDNVMMRRNPNATESDPESQRGIPVSEKTKDWIESVPYFKNTRYGKTNIDLTSDSWDQHGLMVSKGGKNIFTALDIDIKNHTNKFANLSEKEKQKLYAQMTPGTLVSFTSSSGSLRVGLNDKYGLGNSSHSAQVIGYAKDGVPIIFDYGVYRRIDDDAAGVTYGNMNTLSNITIPKEHIGKNLEWAKEKGYFSLEGPEKLDLNLNPLYDEKGADIDELGPFYNTLKTNKRPLMDDLNIKPKDYDMIAKSLIGIAMEETEGGSGIQHNIENNFWGVGQDSVGLTQLMWANIEEDPKLKKIAAKYNITQKSDLKDSKKSAIASMIYGHRNFLSAKVNYEKGKGKPGIRTYKESDSWKTTAKQYALKNPVYDGYTFRTEEGVDVDFFTGRNSVFNRGVVSSIGWDKSIENIQSQFDAIKDKDGKSVKGKYKVREEDGKYVVDKTTLGNGRVNKETGKLEDLTDSEIFAYNWNSPYSLTSGDAQGGTAYVRGIQSMANLTEPKKAPEPSLESIEYKAGGSYQGGLRRKSRASQKTRPGRVKPIKRKRFKK